MRVIVLRVTPELDGKFLNIHGIIQDAKVKVSSPGFYGYSIKKLAFLVSDEPEIRTSKYFQKLELLFQGSELPGEGDTQGPVRFIKGIIEGRKTVSLADPTSNKSDVDLYCFKKYIGDKLWKTASYALVLQAPKNSSLDKKTIHRINKLIESISSQKPLLLIVLDGLPEGIKLTPSTHRLDYDSNEWYTL